jgi:DNA topoisomerase-1
MKLVILESRAKAKTIKKYLGRGWIVDACNGHVQDLPSRGSKDSSKARWASKPGQLPNPPWMWTEKAEQIVTKIVRKAVSSGVDEVYIATDPDREGEFIAWRLFEIFGDFKTVNRISFNEITKEAVLDSIQNPQGLDMNLVRAAMVRRFMDRLVGFRCSKFCRSWKLKSMGRVQTPTLGFIVERELERESHVPIEYHSVSAISNGIELKVRFHDNDDKDAWTDDAGKHFPDRTAITSKAESANSILSKHRNLQLLTVKEGTVRRSPQPPFTTDTLLQTASSTLGWSIAKTSGIASSLYQAGHVTYIRTDSTRTNEGARRIMRSEIERRFGAEYLGEGVGGSAKGKTTKVQDAHEAIRPTKPELAEIEADIDEQNLYKLIWSRFAASQMAKSVRERRQLSFSCEGMIESLYGTSSWRTHPGWEIVFGWSGGEIPSSPPEIGFHIGSVWEISSVPPMITDQTKPPRRLTESSIIQRMKFAGIGRPSTFVSTVSKIIDRGYVVKEGSSLIPTDIGRTLWLEVTPFYNGTSVYGEGLFSSEFTSIMEERLDSIEVGQFDASETWEEFVTLFGEMHNQALERRRERPTLRQLQYLKTAFSRLSDAESAKLLNGKEPDELSGSEAREIIDIISNSDQLQLPASEKQTGLILKLVDKLSIDISAFLLERDVDDITNLTGGRDGTASTIIGELIEMDNSSPATEKQKAAIQSMAESHGLSIDECMEIVSAATLESISKSDASTLISTLKKRRKAKRRK